MQATMSSGPHYWGPSVNHPLQVPSRQIMDELKELLTSNSDAEEDELEAEELEGLRELDAVEASRL